MCILQAGQVLVTPQGVTAGGGPQCTALPPRAGGAVPASSPSQQDVLKLGDFGSCRSVYAKQPHTEYISTRWYRAPECLLTDGCYSYKMDLWSAGCVLYEIARYGCGEASPGPPLPHGVTVVPGLCLLFVEPNFLSAHFLLAGDREQNAVRAFFPRHLPPWASASASPVR